MLKANNSHIANVNEGQISILTEKFNRLDKSIVATAICFNVPLHITKIKIADLGW